jgi:hypothetical protein
MCELSVTLAKQIAKSLVHVVAFVLPIHIMPDALLMFSTFCFPAYMIFQWFKAHGLECQVDPRHTNPSALVMLHVRESCSSASTRDAS